MGDAWCGMVEEGVYGFSFFGHCFFVKSKNMNLPCIVKEEEEEEEEDDDDDDDDDDESKNQS